jgi:maltose-binding protein MalE
MSTQFKLGKAAMILDGPWGLTSYQKAGIDLGVAVMPVLSETGRRLQPMFSYFGWAVSKQSSTKIAAVDLALWLSGDELQIAFALSDFTLPSSRTAWKKPEIAANAILDTYHRQTVYGMQPPTIRATSLVFEQLDTALEMTYKGEMEAQEALDEANAMLIEILGR